MDLDVRIEKHPHNEIAITEVITPSERTYLQPDDSSPVLTYPNQFKLLDTNAIDVIFKETSSESKLECMYITTHDPEELDNTSSVALTVSADGLYSINHIVIPNQQWFDSVKNELNSESGYTYVYYIDDATEIHRVNPADISLD